MSGRATFGSRRQAAIAREAAEDEAAIDPPPADPAPAQDASPDAADSAAAPAPKVAQPKTRPAPKPSKKATKASSKAAAPPQPQPTTPVADDTGWVRVGMRVTPELAHQVGEYQRGFAEQPSYGQLATWTCEDHPQEVIAMTLQILAEKTGGGSSRTVSRAPRGRQPASSATAQLNPTFRAEEFSVVQEVIDQVRHPEGKRVPRTSVITAALRVAVRH